MLTISDTSTAEGFYAVFCSLSKQDRLAITRYILNDREIRRELEQSEIPNDATLHAFAEDKADMPVFDTISELQEDLLL